MNNHQDNILDEATLIAVDWGTSNRRAYLLNHDGDILDFNHDDLGLSKIKNAEFEQALDLLISAWINPNKQIPILLSGMVGASTGWVEAPYCSVPLNDLSLASNLIKAPSNYPAWIIPGASIQNSATHIDVMRGEEIQAFAASIHCHNVDCLIIMPGTHSKWVEMSGGEMNSFTSFLTGDIHSAILSHTVVSLLSEASDHNEKAFLNGVKIGKENYTNLLHIIFGARTKVLAKELKNTDVSSYLSGLLIGAEIQSALNLYKPNQHPIKIVGSSFLSDLYTQALSIFNQPSEIIPLEACTKAYVRIARCAQII